MVAVLDPSGLSGIKSGWFAWSADDERAYLITADGAIPADAVRVLETLDDDGLSRMGSDYFLGSGGEVFIGAPASPVSVGDNGFEGLTSGYFFAAAARTALAGGASLPMLAYDEDWAAYLAAMTVEPSAARKALLYALITGLKADGIWTKLDWLSLFAAHDAQAALLNMVDPTKAFSVVGAPVFTVDRGYAGAGGGYLDSNWNPATHGVQYQRDSASMGLWVNIVTGGISMGNQAAFVQPLVSGTSLRARTNTASNADVAVGSGLGFSAWNRSSSTAVKLFKNGALLSTQSIASEALASDDFFACAWNSSGTPGVTSMRNAALCWGAHLSDAEHLALHDRLNTYLTAIGGAT